MSGLVVAVVLASVAAIPAKAFVDPLASLEPQGGISGPCNCSNPNYNHPVAFLAGTQIKVTGEVTGNATTIECGGISPPDQSESIDRTFTLTSCGGALSFPKEVSIGRSEVFDCGSASASLSVVSSFLASAQNEAISASAVSIVTLTADAEVSCQDGCEGCTQASTSGGSNVDIRIPFLLCKQKQINVIVAASAFGCGIQPNNSWKILSGGGVVAQGVGNLSFVAGPGSYTLVVHAGFGADVAVLADCEHLSQSQVCTAQNHYSVNLNFTVPQGAG